MKYTAAFRMMPPPPGGWCPVLCHERRRGRGHGTSRRAAQHRSLRCCRRWGWGGTAASATSWCSQTPCRSWGSSSTRSSTWWPGWCLSGSQGGAGGQVAAGSWGNRLVACRAAAEWSARRFARTRNIVSAQIDLISSPREKSSTLHRWTTSECPQVHAEEGRISRATRSSQHQTLNIAKLPLSLLPATP